VNGLARSGNRVVGRAGNFATLRMSTLPGRSNDHHRKAVVAFGVAGPVMLASGRASPEAQMQTIGTHSRWWRISDEQAAECSRLAAELARSRPVKASGTLGIYTSPRH